MDLIQPYGLCGDEVTLQCVDQSFRERRAPNYLLWVNLSQYGKRVAAFVIGAFLAIAASQSELVQDIFLGDILNTFSIREGSGPEISSKIPLQRRYVRQKPRLHNLHHEVCLFIQGTCGALPAIARIQMLPRGSLWLDFSFSIDQEQ
ncbi:MAG: hypothetical protein OXI80_17520 [Caldilineaceae bacterium]|nr:hypothetical protein [Caldilineaceae bacterium]MDE0339478.1 hypothetical protein [Caldilineaceae bacterium]